MSLANGGWIKLHRKILDNWIWDDPEKLRAWIDLLLMVNHEEKEIPFNGHIRKIGKGQRLTSLSQLGERWGWSRNRVDRFLQLLSEANMVTADRTPNGTLLTIVNYGVYQDQRDSNEATYGAADGATNEATYGATVGAQTRTIKKEKNDKKERSVYRRNNDTPTLEEIETYCEEHGIQTDTARFFAYNDAKGWPMPWIAALAMWAAKDKEKREQPKASGNRMNWFGYEQREAPDWDEEERKLLGY